MAASAESAIQKVGTGATQALGIGLAAPVNRTVGSVEEVGLDDVTGDADLLIGRPLCGARDSAGNSSRPRPCTHRRS